MTRVTQINGFPVIDARKPLVVRITQRDITRAHETQAPASCAMARACLRELHCIEVRVHITRTYIRMNDSNWQRYMTSYPLRQQILGMAAGIPFEPGEFTLGNPPPSKRHGAIHVPSKRTGRGKKRRPYVLSNVRARATTT
jgi:hypothetical protein